MLRGLRPYVAFCSLAGRRDRLAVNRDHTVIVQIACTACGAWHPAPMWRSTLRARALPAAPWKSRLLVSEACLLLPRPFLRRRR